jgi:hypothetical protein
MVETTLKDPQKLPTDILADEKHAHFNGQTAYLATTVAQDCVFGVSLSLNADEPALTEAYAYVKQEAQALGSDYAPQTPVNLVGPRYYFRRANNPAKQPGGCEGGGVGCGCGSGCGPGWGCGSGCGSGWGVGTIASAAFL